MTTSQVDEAIASTFCTFIFLFFIFQIKVEDSDWTAAALEDMSILMKSVEQLKMKSTFQTFENFSVESFGEEFQWKFSRYM